MYGFICTVLAAFLTAFYSWRLMIMTFHGKPRADHHVMEHVHESPPVMLVPLVVLAVGAVVAGMALDQRVHRRGLAGVLGRQHLRCCRATTCWRRSSRCRSGSEYAPLVFGLARHRAGLPDVHRSSRCCRAGSRRVPAASTCSC